MINQGLTVAATMGMQGGRRLYQLLVPNSVLNNFFTINLDPPEEKSQRQLDPKHAEGIRDYLVDNVEGYVLGALIYAVDRDCLFEPSELDPNLGALTIPFGANLRSLDGQHRRKGLNDAIAEESELSNDHTAVLIYVEPDVVRRRQVFSDLNSTPRKVSKAINVAFDHRDPFARVAQGVAKTHPLLAGRIELERASVPGSSDSWYTLGALHDALKRLIVGPSGRVKKPTSFDETNIELLANNLLAALGSIETIQQVDKGLLTPSEARAKTIVFSSTTLRAIASAYYLFTKATPGATWAQFTGQLRTVDFSTTNPDWADIGFLTQGRATPNARQQEVTAASKYIAGTLER